MLEAKNIHYAIAGKDILREVSFSLEGGKHLLVLGHSGCGKTTLLAILAGLLQPGGGEVRYGETHLYRLNEAERDRFRGQKLGILFQNYHLVKTLTVKQNLQVALSLSDKPPQEVPIMATLDRLGLVDKANQKAGSLSLGEAQRLAVARAVIGRPEWIFCDEPTSALDDANTAKMLALLTDEAAQCGASLVVVTHDARVKSHFAAEQILNLGAAA